MTMNCQLRSVNKRITVSISRLRHKTPHFHLGPLTIQSQSFSAYEKIAFIGTGKMAQAMIAPLIDTSIQSADKIMVYDVSTSSMKLITHKFKGVKTSESIPQAIDGADLIIMAVKPQNVNKVYQEMRNVDIHDETTLLSVIAGKTIQHLTSGSGVKKVCRSMPNTPAVIGQGMTVWCCTPNINANEREKISSVLESFGKSIYGKSYSIKFERNVPLHAICSRLSSFSLDHSEQQTS